MRPTLRLLGSFRGETAARRALRLPTRKSRALLAYLALRPGQRQTRDAMTALLWGDTDDARARGSFRQALYSVRRAVGPRAIVIDGDGLTLVASALDVDATRFETLAAGGRPAALAAAASLYGGDLLEGFHSGYEPFDDWLRTERARVRELAVRVFTKLLAHKTAAGAIEDAIGTATRLLTLDPALETAHRALMRLYARDGRRGAALKQYQTCAEILQREFGVEPEPETRRVYQEILQRLSPAAGATAGGRSRVRAAMPAKRPLVGRDKTIVALRRMVESVERGAGGIVVIAGEAGIGKSRLLDEMVAHAHTRGDRVLLGRCYETEQSLPFAPWVDALRASGIVTDPAALAGLTAAWRAELARLLPELGDPPMPNASDHHGRLRLFEAVLRLLRHLATVQPVTVLLEDVHWADEISLGLFAFVARRVEGAAVLLAATVREEEVADTPALGAVLDELRGHPRFYEVRLSRLSHTETLTLVRLLGGVHRIATAATLGEQLWTASQGNPFMVVETMRTLQEGEAPAMPGTLPIPASVQDVIARRLDRLGDSAERLVAIAAAIGRDFDFELLRRAASADAETAAVGLEELVRRRMLHGSGESFDFTHDRIREVAYGRLLPARRRVLHGRIAAALEAVYATGAQPNYGAIALHYKAAQQWDAAARYFHLAGSQAFVRSANRDAAALFESALAMLAHLPHDRALAGETVDIRLELRNALWPLGELDAVWSTLDLAERDARALDDPLRLGWITTFMTFQLWLRGETAHARAAGDSARVLAAKASSAPLAAATALSSGMTHHTLGDFGAAEEFLQRVITALPGARERDRFGVSGLPAAQAHGWLGWCLADRGEREGAITHGREALRIADAPEHAWSLAVACWVLGHLHLAFDQIDEARSAAERGLRVCRDARLPLWLPALTELTGYAYARSGSVKEGLELLAEGTSTSAARGMGLFHSIALVHAAEAHLVAGAPSVAITHAEDAVAVTRARGQRVWEARALRVRGDVAARIRDSKSAARDYADSLAIAHAAGMAGLVAECRARLAPAS